MATTTLTGFLLFFDTRAYLWDSAVLAMFCRRV
jgi:hypothetical protein